MTPFAFVFWHEASFLENAAWHAWPTSRSIPSELPARHIWHNRETSRAFPSSEASCQKTKLRKVSLWKASKKMSVYFELKANPMRPGSKHHDEPILLPFNSSRNCVICKNPTRRHCWGCNEDPSEVFPVCPVSVRPNCNAEMHRIRRNIWVYHEFSKQFTKQNMYWYNQNFDRITIWLLYIIYIVHLPE